MGCSRWSLDQVAMCVSVSGNDRSCPANSFAPLSVNWRAWFAKLGQQCMALNDIVEGQADTSKCVKLTVFVRCCVCSWQLYFVLCTVRCHTLFVACDATSVC